MQTEDHESMGLPRAIVRLVAYSPRWPLEFERVRGCVAKALGDLALRVEHVGSTAVPGLVAKPIIDVAIGVRDGDAATQTIPLLVAAGFEFRGDAGSSGGLVFVEGPEERRTAHLHVVTAASTQWRAYEAFRDRLRNDSAARRDYAAVKQRLTAAHSHDRSAYTNGKASFIEQLLGVVPPSSVARRSLDAQPET